MSLSRIAKLSGFSTSTVSRVINNDPRISDATAERIRESIAKVGYVPKPAPARGRRAGLRTGSVAVVECGNHAYGASFNYQIERGAATRLAQHGLNMILVYVEDDTMPHCFARREVDGVIVMSGEPSGAIAERILDFPSVWVVSRQTATGSYVVGGHDTGGRLAAQYLLDKGHRKLAFLNPWPSHPAFQARADGFEFAAGKAGASVRLIVPEPRQPMCTCDADMLDFDRIEGCMALLVDRWLAMDPRPSGVFVPTDMLTAVLYRLLGKRKIQPGRDLHVISANNEEPYLAGLYPRPATIDIGSRRIGESAVDQLLLRIQNPAETRGLRMIVEPIVIEGETLPD